MVLIASPAVADMEVIRLDPWSGTIAGRTMTLPLAVTMSEAAPDAVAITFEAELSQLVDALPALLSRVYLERCDHRFAIEVRDARPTGGPGRGTRLLLDGEVLYEGYGCTGETRGRRTIKQAGELEVEIGLTLQDGCPHFEIGRLDLDPNGLGGFILNASGATEQIERDTRAGLSEALNADVCFELPAEMRALDARPTSAVFLAPGGRLAAHLSYELTANAETLIDLVVHLTRE